MKEPSLVDEPSVRRMARAVDADAGGQHAPRGGLAALAIGAIGVVYGDIGTSPLYAIDQIFFGSAAVAPTPENVLGAISAAIWTIFIIVAVKYALLVLRAENDGEGGVFALYGLLHKYKNRGARVLLWSLMLGAGLLLGDGMITPAISVLSAVEGLDVATPAFAPYVPPITIALLTALFSIQHRGASGIGVIFGPIMIVWFITIAVLGGTEIAREPAILAAFNPALGVRFLARSGPREALLILGALMLVITGGEAMYADLGHFGARPIRVGWFAVVFPALLLNYLGQGAHLLGGEPIAAGKLFYSLAPAPLVILATLATVVASQALISGAFSLTSQAIGLGLFPRFDVKHTHLDHAGQIYIPVVNWGLYLGCVALVIGFGSSSALAAAYGLAVAGVPLAVGVAAFLVMATWRWGRKATFAAYAARSTMTMADVVALHRSGTSFLERNALIMAPVQVRHLADRAPALVGLLWERYGVFPRNLILVEVVHPKVPYIHDHRYHVTVFDRDQDRGSVIGVELRFGFMEEPNVELCLEDLARHREIDLPGDPGQWIVHVSHENLLPARQMNLFRRLRFRLFLFLRLISGSAYHTYHLGEEVQLSAEIMPVRVR